MSTNPDGSLEIKQKGETPKRVSTANIHIKGLTTEQIARAIRERLMVVDGVRNVRMSITDQSARVEYEPSKISPTSVATLIGQMGYTYTVASLRRTM
jgi:copper chaperone CopZ